MLRFRGIIILVFFQLATTFAQDENWQNMSSPLGKVFLFTLTDSNKTLLQGTSNGFFRSYDFGKNWILIDSLNKIIGSTDRKNLIGYNFQKLNNAIFIAPNKGGVYRSTDSGNSWEKSLLPDTIYFVIQATNNTVYAMSKKMGMFYSTDIGKTWNELFYNESGEKISIHSLPFRDFFTCENCGLYVWIDTCNIIKTLDNGQTWTKIKIPVLPENSRIMNIKMIDKLFYILTQPRDLFLSEDEGIHLTKLKIPEKGFYYINSKEDKKINLTLSNYVRYQSVDNGKTWQKIDYEEDIKKLYRINDNIIIRSRDIGNLGKILQQSDDNGTTWRNNFVSFTGTSSIKKGPDGLLYAVSQYNGIYRSTNSGDSWDVIFTDPLTIRDIQFLTNNMFVVRCEYGLYITTDSCKTWKVLNIPDSSNISLITSKDNVLLLGAQYNTNKQGGLWRSTDLGNSWQRVFVDSCCITTDDGHTWLSYDENSKKYIAMNKQPFISINSIWYDFERNILVEANINSKWSIYKSTDFGLTWDKQKDFENDVFRVSNYRQTSRGEVFNGIRRSTDGGKTFTVVINGLLSNSASCIYPLPDGSVLACTERGLFYLPYQGNTWYCVGFKNKIIRDVILNDKYILASVGDGEIFRTDLKDIQSLIPNEINQPEVWRLLNNSYKIYYMNFTIDEAGTFWCFDLKDKIIKSTDEGKTWSKINLPDGFGNIFAVHPKCKFIIVGSSNGLIKFDIQKEIWDTIKINSYQNDILNKHYIGAIYIEPNDDIFIAVEEQMSPVKTKIDSSKKIIFYNPLRRVSKFYRFNHVSEKWETLDSLLIGEVFDIFKNKNGTLFARAYNNGLFRSTNNGENWNKCDLKISYEGFVLCGNDKTAYSVLTYAFDSQGTMYITSGFGKMAYSSDDGITWIPLTSPENNIVYELLVGPDDEIYAASASGVYLSRDKGKSWVSYSAGLTSEAIKFMKKHPNGYIYAISDDRKIYVSTKKIFPAK